MPMFRAMLDAPGRVGMIASVLVVDKTTEWTGPNMEAWEKIIAEQKRQVEKWGIQHHGSLRWLAILMEEVGELSKAIIENADEKDIEKELIQCAAVCATWLENYDD